LAIGVAAAACGDGERGRDDEGEAAAVGDRHSIRPPSDMR
jgi:hypothetical protein